MRFYVVSYPRDGDPESSPLPIFRSKSAAMRHVNKWAEMSEDWEEAEVEIVEFRGTNKQKILDAWANMPTNREIIFETKGGGVIVTEVQLAVLRSMDPLTNDGPTFRPRGSLERLQKKGLVEGNPRQGWQLTLKGWDYLRRTNERK